MQLDPKQTLDNRYELVEKIGAGGACASWKAIDTRFGDEVVIKIPHSISKPVFLTHFNQSVLEMRRLAAESVYILDIGDVFKLEDRPCYVMRYLAGGNLRSWQLHRSLDSAAWNRQQYQWLSRIGSALDYLHAHDVMHRSVKPQNILFNRSESSCLADFGVDINSDQTQTVTMPVKSIENWVYVPPEHLSGEPFVPQSDQYSLAVCLYESVVGEPPFVGDTPIGIVKAIMKGHRSLVDVLPEFPAEASIAVDRALSVDVGDRFESCQQFAEAFLQALQSDPQSDRREIAGGEIDSPAQIEDDDEIVDAVIVEEDPATGGMPGPNDVVNGQYKIIEPIASAGIFSNSVWLAEDRERQDQVAIKFAPAHQAAELADEIKVMQSLEGCSGIQQVLDVGEVRGVPYVVLEYLPGGTVLDWQVRYDDKGDFLLSFRWLFEIAKLLDQMHQSENWVLHQDVRPDNIAFDSAGSPFLVEFGVAKSSLVIQEKEESSEYDTDEHDGMVKGTLKCLAPELLEGLQSTAMSDQYGLAVTLYWSLAGIAPHDGETVFDLFKSHQKGHAPLHEQISGFPLSASDAVDKALQADPAQRYENCSQFAIAFLADLRTDSEQFEACFPIAPYVPPAVEPEVKEPLPESQTPPGHGRELYQSNQLNDSAPPSSQDSDDGLRIGEIVCDRYELIEKLYPGRYGSGWSSWLVKDSAGDLFVFKQPHNDGNSAMLGEFRIDTDRMFEVSNHCEQMLSMHETGLEDFTPFCVSPYMAGGSLREKITARQGKTRLDATQFGWLMNIARAIDHSCSQGIDVVPKPENILFDDDSNAFLTDFYFDPGPGGATDFKHVFNSWPYLRAVGSGPTRMLAVTVYEFIAGTVPGRIDQATDRFQAATPKPLSDIMPEVASEVSDLVAKAMEGTAAESGCLENNQIFAEQFLAAISENPIELDIVFEEQTESSPPKLSDKTSYPMRPSDQGSAIEIVGEVIGKRYEITEKIGDFGMATTWIANDLKLSQRVVLKSPFNQPDLFEKFEEEVEIWKAVEPNNQGVAPILDIGEHEGMPFFVTPFLGGGTLSDWKAKRTSVGDIMATFAWIVEISRTLDQIHEAGFCHRDVKADNILFDQSGKAHLIDFGISSPLDQVPDTDEGSFLGTMLHLAPEILDGTTIGSRTADQYALAVTLYEWLAGRKPFVAATPLALIKELFNGAPTLTELIPGFPVSVSNVVAQALSQDPDRRFDSCGDFAESFMSALFRESCS